MSAPRCSACATVPFQVPALVLTFKPHPRKVFRPAEPLFILTPSAMKAKLLAELGFDAMVEFPPNNTAPPLVTDKVRKLNPDFSGNVYDWSCFPERSRRYETPPHTFYRGVNPGWDNEARKPGVSNIFVNASPRGYEEWLVNAMRDTIARFDAPDQRLVFINAWNEWAEGAHLEPDVRLGYAWLDATRRAVEQA